MPKLEVKGDLTLHLGEIADVFTGAIGRSVGGIATFAGNDLMSATLIADKWFSVPSSGPDFMTGIIDEMKLRQFVPAGRFDDLLKLSNLSFDAQKAFDLESRTVTSNLGTFNEKAFGNYLAGLTWKIAGSNEVDRVIANTKIKLGGDDVIRVKGGNDVVAAGGGDDVVSGGKGADRIAGQAGHDDLFGDGGADNLNGGKGQDHLNGGDDADLLIGGRDGDRLNGERGADALRGGQGVDLLTGGKGDDNLVGGKGADRFVFKSGHGDDVIKDFQTGVDTLDFATPRDLLMATVASGTVISYDGGSVTLRGVELDDLNLIGDLWT